MRNKVLILTYEMIPYSNTFGGCQRMYFLAEHLADNGIDVTVVSAKKKYNGFFGKKINFKSLYYGQEIIENNNLDNNKMFTNNNLLKTKIKNILRKTIEKVSNFYFNEPSNLLALRAFLWLKKYKNNVLSSIENNDIGTVIISGPPFTLFSMVKDIKTKHPKVKVILDYRDPWGLWNYNKSFAFLREKNYLNNANEIIVVTPIAEKDTFTHFKTDTKISVVYNGYSDLVWEGIEIKSTSANKKIKISFIGSIDFLEDSYRDTRFFFKAYEGFKDIFELYFVGVEKTKIVEDIMIRYPEIKILPIVTQEESLQYMLDSDVLLTLHTANDASGKYLIQGKIFDYLKSGKIIFSIGLKDDFTNIFINNHNLGLTCGNNVEEIKNAFDTLIELKNKNSLSNFRGSNNFNIEDFSRENQNNKFLSIINKYNIKKGKKIE